MTAAKGSDEERARLDRAAARLAVHDELVAALRDLRSSCAKWAPTIDRSRADAVLRKVKP